MEQRIQWNELGRTDFDTAFHEVTAAISSHQDPGDFGEIVESFDCLRLSWAVCAMSAMSIPERKPILRWEHICAAINPALGLRCEEDAIVLVGLCTTCERLQMGGTAPESTQTEVISKLAHICIISENPMVMDAGMALAWLLFDCFPEKIDENHSKMLYNVVWNSKPKPETNAHFDRQSILLNVVGQ